MTTDQARENFLDISAEGIDLALQHLKDNELLSDVPVMGLIYKTCKTASSISNIFFIKKLSRFIQLVNDKTTQNERLEFAHKLKNDRKTKDDLYSSLFLKIDKFDDLSKPDLFAKIFCSFITNKIRWEDFGSLSHALSQCNLVDLNRFSSHLWIKKVNFRFFYPENSHISSLVSAGLMEFSLKKGNTTSENIIPTYNIEYGITELGFLYSYISEDLEEYFHILSGKEKRRSVKFKGYEHYKFITARDSSDLFNKIINKWPKETKD